MSKRGKFIVVDGGEGSGKSKLMKSLPEIFPEGKFLATREPGGSPFAEEIRTLMLASGGSAAASAESQFGLIWAARHDHLTKTIIPALEQGINVISDRFDSSTYAYQIFGQETPQLEKLFWEIREVYLRVQKPDLYVFLDVPPELGLQRVAKRTKSADHFDQRALSFHQRIYEGFQAFLKHVPHRVVDTGKTLEESKRQFFEVMRKAVN